MKKLLIFAVLISLSFWGCAENSNVVGPADSQQQETFLKVSNGSVSDLTVEAKSALGIEDVNTLNKFSLPSSTSKVVSSGDALPFMLGADGVLSLGKLDILSGASNETVTVKILTEEIVALDLSGADPTSSLTAAFIGVDVEAGETVNFVYLDDKNEKITVDKVIVGNGWVVVVNAHLPHFSRYGFTK